MKVDNRSPISIDVGRAKSKESKAAGETKSQAKGLVSNKPEDVQKALDRAVSDIESSGLTAGEVHSSVDETRLTGFLKSIDVQAKQPRLSDDELLKMADKVSTATRENPAQASSAFNTPDASRVAELV